VPHELTSTKDFKSNALRDFLKNLPIPLMKIPASCLYSPWWLVFLGHEVAHHVEADLLRPLHDNQDFFFELVRNATNNDSDWCDWKSEIFADLMSVLFMGTMAIRCAAEFDYGEKLYTRKDVYPSAAIRLRIMFKVAENIGLPTDEILHLLPPDVDEPEYQKDLQFVEPIANLAQTKIFQNFSLTELTGFDINLFKGKNGGSSLFENARRMRKQPNLVLAVRERGIHTARIITSSAFYSWAMTVGMNEAEATTQTTNLRSSLVDNIIRNAPNDRSTRSLERSVQVAPLIDALKKADQELLV